jgi:hypothetical protein
MINISMRIKEFITESISWNDNAATMQPDRQSFLKKGVLVRANINEILGKSPKKLRLDPTDPTGGKNARKGNVSNAIDYWSQGNPMDPSVLNVHNGKVNFIDGRHRLVAAAQLGETEAPVIIAPADNLRQAKELLKLTKW